VPIDSDKPGEESIAHDDTRREAMASMLGLWKDRTDLPDAEVYVRQLRAGSRLKRLSETNIR
jgi:hypothetical protein